LVELHGAHMNTVALPLPLPALTGGMLATWYIAAAHFSQFGGDRIGIPNGIG